MKVAIIFNRDLSGVINVFGMQNKEVYNPETVNKGLHPWNPADTMWK